MDKKEINSLKDLHQYKVALKQKINFSEDKIKHDAKGFVKKTAGKFIAKRTGNNLIESKTKLLFKPKDTISKASASAVNRLFFKKSGFFKKLVISFFVKKCVKQIISHQSANQSKQIIQKNTNNDPSNLKLNMSSITKEEVKRVNKKLTFKGIWEVLKNSFDGFSEHKVTKISGSLAYYTVFSMAPLLVVIISLCGIFLGREAAEGQIYDQLKTFLGSDTAIQLQQLIQKASISGKGNIAFVIGIITLLVGATSVFADIQDSINTIWGIKPKPKRGWLKMLQNRFLSFSVIISLGFLLLVSLGVNAVLDAFSNRLQARFEDISVIVFYILNMVVTLVVITLIFGVIYKVLPDAEIKWKDVFSGALATAILFMIGKFGISIYIGQSNVGSTYGAAGSLVVLLLWTYYSSIILYFGAEFTKAYAVAYGSEIHPSHYAVTTKQIEVETNGKSIQQNEKAKSN